MTVGDKPLSGWRVLVPRGGTWGDGVAATLRGFGAIPVIAPLINFATGGPTRILHVGGEFVPFRGNSRVKGDWLAVRLEEVSVALGCGRTALD